ncbi:MAG: signal peptidase I [Anaerovoracaceae bacterium]
MKALKVIKTAVVWLIGVIAIAMMIFTIVSVTTFDQTDRDLFGYKAFIILSDSMSKTDFSAGDLVLVKEVEPSTLKEGDIISYISQNTANYGETVTHKIRALKTDANGEQGFITYGTTTDTDDETIVTYPHVLGKFTGHIPKIGTFFQFLKTTPGYIVCILTPFLLLILLEGIRCIRLFKQYKAEQIAELQAERDKIEVDRAEAQRMMQELLQMKAQMANSNVADSDNSQAEEDTDVNGSQPITYKGCKGE